MSSMAPRPRRRRRPIRAPAARSAGLLAFVNSIIVLLSSVALVIAALVLTYSVASRYFLHLSTDWQDELSVFLIVGAVFMSSASIQAKRGHVGIEAIVGLLSPRVNHWRQLAVDVASFLFCAFFSWKSWAAARRGLGRELPLGIDLGSAPVDSLFADDRRHDAAQPADPDAGRATGLARRPR